MSEERVVGVARDSDGPGYGPEVPVGYRRTEVGVIPEDWQCLRVRDVATICGGKRLPSGYALTADPTPHPYIRIIDMYPGGVRRSGLTYVPEKAFPMIQRYRIYSDDIFISVAGTLGIVGIVPPELNGANLTENADRITDLKCDRDYLKYWLMSQPIQDSISAIATIGAQPKLALGRIGAFAVVLPRDSAEQRAIAAVLADVDELIGSLEALIAKKRAIKQAAMQELLAGRTRLPGFGGEWAVLQLGDFVRVRDRKVSPAEVGGNTPSVELEHIGQSNGRLVRHGTAVTASSIKYRFEPHDILFGRLRPYLRKWWYADRRGICSTEIWPLVVDPGTADSGFVYALIQTSRLLDAAENSYGTHMPRADWNIVSGVEFPLPPLPEQRAIAAVLSDMDAEITAMERRLHKTRAIKQGMMQQLLTGAIRLPIPDTAPHEIAEP